jgi:phage antirepressor YoqD-like protein
MSELQIFQNAVQRQMLSEMMTKASYYDVVLNSPDLVSITEIAKDTGGVPGG